MQFLDRALLQYQRDEGFAGNRWQPKNFADMQISVGGRTGTVYLGADDSRQANSLNTDESTTSSWPANYLLGEHVITAGYDREELEIFNIFVQHSDGGEYDFFDDSANNDPACAALTAQDRLDDMLNLGCSPSGIDRFELGRPSRIYYGSGGGTNDRHDAAAKFTNALNSALSPGRDLFRLTWT